MEFKIEDGIDLPKMKAPEIDFKLLNLKVGQSFRVGEEIVSNARYACKQANIAQKVKGFRTCVETQLAENESKKGLYRVHCIQWDNGLIPVKKDKVIDNTLTDFSCDEESPLAKAKGKE